jgi:hypothetical protein
MKKLTIILALAVAALASAGMARHRQNPMTAAGKAIPAADCCPFPPCPPDCGPTGPK